MTDSNEVKTEEKYEKFRGKQEVFKFSLYMIEKLSRRAHKGDWKEQSPVELLDGFENEIEELKKAKTATEMMEELVDIANYCMILADKLGYLNYSTDTGGI